MKQICPGIYYVCPEGSLMKGEWMGLGLDLRQKLAKVNVETVNGRFFTFS